jgi:hypothetical protein
LLELDGVTRPLLLAAATECLGQDRIVDLIPPPVGDSAYTAQLDTDPNLDVTTSEVRQGGYTTFIGIRSYEASFNVMSHSLWSTGKCDWGRLRGTIECVKDLAFGPVGDDDNLFSDSYDIVIPPGEYSSTGVNVQCPSHVPFVAHADLFFLPEGTVPIVEEP